MHISIHNLDDLNAKVVVNLAPSDYQSLVENKLKEYGRKVNMPGFRPGKVPAGMVKKMYGTSVLIDEVNNLLSKKLYEYIQEEKLNILGSPLPSETTRPKADWERPGEMEFTYDLGLAPKFELKIDAATTFTQYIIGPTETDIQGALENLSRRNGEMKEVDVVGETDLVKLQWVELNADGTVKEGGVMHSSSVSMDALKEKQEARSKLLGLKAGDSAVVDHTLFSNNDTDRASMLNVSKDELPEVNPDFKVTVEKIQRLIPAEINEELFKRMYTDGSVTDIEALKEKIREDYRGYFSKESDRRLKNDIVLRLLSELNIALPDAFLKRWLVVTNEDKKVTAEQVEQEYASYANGLKWQLIENRIIREHQLMVNAEELRAGVREQLLQQFAAYGINQADDAMMDDMVDRFLKREDEVRKVNDELYDRKVLELFKEKFTLVANEVSSEEFYESLSQQHITA
ncbi:MAG: trigger factor [Flavobacteriales bacterium]|nr:trigger factor [Flavobacteriales bacterium]